MGRGIVNENYNCDGIADHTKPNPAILAVLFPNVRLDQERSTGREILVPWPKSRPCFLTFSAFLLSSHSNRIYRLFVRATV
jgi:hypothetical protein